MDIVTLFAIGGVTIFLGFLSEYIFEKTEIPDALWLILFGIMLSHFFNFSQTKTFSEVGLIFTTFALIFMLFEGVLKINFKELFKSLGEGTAISLMHFIFTMLITAAAMLLLGWNFLEGLLLGAILGDSAQTIIIPILKKIRIKTETALILTFESAISDVFCIVGTLTIINIILLKSVTVATVVQTISYAFILGLLAGALQVLSG